MRIVRTWISGAALALLLALGVAARAQEDGWDDGARERKVEEERMRHEKEDQMRREVEERQRMKEGGGPQKGPGGPFGPLRPPRPVLTEKDIEEVMAWLKEWDPDRLQKMQSQRVENPDFFMELMGDGYQEMKKVLMLKQIEPARYEEMIKERKLDLQCRQLSEKYRTTEDAGQKTAIKNELNVIVGQLFDIRETGREKEVKELERRLTQLREIVEKRRTNKMQIVENRLRQLLGEKEFMDW